MCKYLKTLFFLIVMLLSVMASSETITVDKDKLAALIRTEVTKAVNSAVDEAVSVAIKDTENKYIFIIADKDIKIADLTGLCDKKDIEIKALNIQKKNVQIDFDNYKRQALVNYTFTGALGLLSGLVIFGVFNLFR